MNCPYCNKYIYALTGLQELQKFQKHLIKCKKNPKRKSVITEEGKLKYFSEVSMKEALDIRAESGQ